MNKIEKLIQQYCPEGVEWKKLGEIALITIGEFVHKNKQDPNAKYPVFNGGTGPTGYYENYNNKGPKIIISARGANAGFVNKYYSNYWAGNSCYSISVLDGENVDFDFLYYFLKKDQNQFTEKQQKGGIPAVSKSQIHNFIIPIPPLPVQEEIVNILDKFTSLEAELEAELKARTKQYEYYRNQLLSPEKVGNQWILNGVEVGWKTLGEICNSISAGGDLPKNYSKDQLHPSSDYPYPIYANSVENDGLYGYTDNYRIQEDSVTISARGAKIGFHTVRQGKYTPIIRLICLVPNTNIIRADFLNYALYLVKIIGTKGGIPQLTVPMVKKLKIPIPPLSEQERIVAILDQFDALVNDISVGIPAEQSARKQQYEYYREKLLSF